MPVVLSVLSHAHIADVVALIDAPARAMLREAGATAHQARARVARLKGPRQIAAMLEAPAPDVLYGARDAAGTLLGVAGLRVSAPGEAELHTMYLAQAAQGRGLGRALTEQRLDHARAAGLDSVYLRTATSNLRIQRLAASLGFTLSDYLDEPSMPGVAWQIWRLHGLQHQRGGVLASIQSTEGRRSATSVSGSR